MDPVSWLENVAEGSPVVLLLVVMLALFMDSLAVVGALLPGDLLLLVPSAAVGLPGSLIVVLGGVLGTVLGYTVSYGVGRWAGPAIQNSWLGRRVGEHRWVRAELMLRGPAGNTLALVQFMPVLNYLIPLLAGTLKVPLKRFVQRISIGAVVYCSCYVFLGALAGGTGEAIGESTGRLGGVLVAAAVAALSFTVLAKTVHRVADKDKQDACRGEEVDGEPPNVADSAACSVATVFSTGTGSRCP
ncbi:MAG: DedA family protein [Pseudonocardiaceae bacterium]